MSGKENEQKLREPMLLIGGGRLNTRRATAARSRPPLLPRKFRLRRRSSRTYD